MLKEQHLGVGERLLLWVLVHECTDNKTENNYQHTPVFEVCSHLLSATTGNAIWYVVFLALYSSK